MKKKLKIKVDRYGKKIVGKVVCFDESNINKGLLLKLDSNNVIRELWSIDFPDIENYKLYLWGMIGDLMIGILKRSMNL